MSGQVARSLLQRFGLSKSKEIRSDGKDGQRARARRQLRAEMLESRRLLAVGDLLSSVYPIDPQTDTQEGFRVAANDQYIVTSKPYADVGGVVDRGVLEVYDAATRTHLYSIENPTAASTDFGYSLDLDGSRVVVGARLEDAGATDAGRAYVFNLSETSATLARTINNPFPNAEDRFGQSVSISGDTVVVGAYWNDSIAADTGSVYVFYLSGPLANWVGGINNPQPGPSDQFGFSVAVDGNALVVGTPADDLGATNSGAAYLYDINGVSIMLQATIANPSPAAADGFGYDVDVSGDTVVVGAHRDDTGGTDSGSAYIYDISGNGAVITATVNNPLPADNDWFGYSLALGGSTLVVGALSDDTGANHAGSAYVYDLTGGTAVLTETLNNPSPNTSDQFGFSVAVGGSTIVIGTRLEDTPAHNAGGAYVYQLNSGAVELSGKVSHASPVVNIPVGTSAGREVAVDGNFMAIGVPGSDAPVLDSGRVFLYEFVGGQATLVTTIDNPLAGQGDFFGSAVAISGNRLVVGSYLSDAGAADSGRAYVFDISSHGALLRTVLENPSPAVGDTFGDAVAIDGDKVVVGAPGDDSNGSDSGSVYVFDVSGALSVLEATINNPEPATSRFGEAVAINDGRVVIGNAIGGGDGIGKAFMFSLASGNAVLTATFENPTPESNDRFGNSVSISGDTVVVAASNDNTNASASGSVYVFDVSQSAPTLRTSIHNPAPRNAGKFGSSVSLDGNKLAVGAIHNNDAIGGAYLYTLNGNSAYLRATLLNPSPVAQSFFGNTISISGDRVVVGAHGDDTLTLNGGAAYVYSSLITNVPPTAQDDQLFTPEDTVLNLNVLADNGNGPDTDLDGNLVPDLTQLLSTPKHGSLQNHSDGSFIYTPNLNFHGNDSFTYQIADDYGETATATVSLTVTPVNDAPTVDGPVLLSFSEDDAGASIDLLSGAQDVDAGDVLSVANLQHVSGDVSGITIQSNPLSMSIAPAAYNSLVAGAVKTIRYSYEISDSTGALVPQSLEIQVEGRNDLPLPSDDSATTDEDSQIVITVLANDVDPDQDFGDAFGQPGTLDASFGNDGLVTVNVDIATNQTAQSVLTQPDGKILVAGTTEGLGTFNDFVVARFLPDGTPDQSFGQNGIAATSISGSNSNYGLDLQSDGKIVLAGNRFSSGDSDFAVLRFLSNGTLDTAYGDAGVVSIDFGSTSFPGDQAYAIRVDANDNLLVVGSSRQSSGVDVAIARLTATDGSLDASFGSGGKIVSSFSSGTDIARDVTVLSDGKILIAGEAGGDVFIARYLTNGTPDVGFGAGGRVLHDVGAGSASGVQFSHDALTNQVVVGFTAASRISVARFSSSGVLTSGPAQLPALSPSTDLLTDLSVKDGKTYISVDGGAFAGSSRDFVIARLISDGSLDPSFGNGGVVQSDNAQQSDRLYGITIDGTRIVAVGSTQAAQQKTEMLIVAYDDTGIVSSGFGQNGRVNVDIPVRSEDDRTHDVVVQNDGKIIVVGSALSNVDTNSHTRALASRLNSDGSLDTQFANGGIAGVTFGGSRARANAVALQDDGKVVIAGHADPANNSDFAIARFTSSGELDPTFGGSGFVMTDLGQLNNEEAYGIVVQSDGKILVAGESNGDFAIVRYLTDGSMDATFGNSGVTSIDIGGQWGDTARALAVQQDGKIILAGRTGGPSTGYLTAVARLNSNGSPDTAFGTGGISSINLPGTASTVIVLPEGKLLISGGGLARLNGDGTLDTSFDQDGIMSSSVTGNVEDMHRYDDGRVATIGYQFTTSNRYDYLVSLLTPEGALDSSFSDDGRATIDFGQADDDYALGLAVQANGAIVVAGYSDQSGNGTFSTGDNDIAVARLFGPTPSTTTPIVQAVDDSSSRGQVTLSPGGSVTYDPRGAFDSMTAGQTATDAFTYTIVDSAGATGTATVTITIEGVNSPIDLNGNLAPGNDYTTTFVEDGGPVLVQSTDLLLEGAETSAGGPLGAEFQVNSYTAGRQELLGWTGGRAVATDHAGNFMVVWSSYQQDGSETGVYAQRYNVDGSTAGPEIQANTYTNNDQTFPSVAMDAAGNAVVVWASTLQDGSSYGIYAQRYDASGQPAGGEFRVNTYRANGQSYPTVAMSAVGEFVVAWTGYGQDGEGDGIFAQRYDASGNAVGGEFQVNTFSTGNQLFPTAAISDSGDFVIAWQSEAQDGADFGVFAQRFAANGTALGGEFQVNSYTTNRQSEPSVAMDSAGNFTIVWTSFGQDGSAYGIYGQRFDSAGGTLGGEFRVNAITDSHQLYPSIAMNPEGHAVVTWMSIQGANAYEVAAQLYDANGTSIGDELLLNTFRNGSQDHPSVALAPSGEFVVAWTSDDQDGSGDGIFAQRYFGGFASAVEFEQATVLITNPLDGTGESLQADTTGTNITANYIGGLLTLSGVDTAANYQQVLRTVAYDNSSQSPDATDRIIEFRYTANSVVSQPSKTTLSIVPTNDAPSVTALSASVLAENQITVAGHFDDPDSGDSHTVTVQWHDGQVQTEVLPVGQRTFQLQRNSGTVPSGALFSITVSDDSLANASSQTALTTVVSSTNNDGPGSLRQAVRASNLSAGTDTITFHIGAGGPQTIAVTSNDSLYISDPVHIDGTSQPGYAGESLITLDASSFGGYDLIQILSGSSTVNNLIVTGHSNSAVLLGSQGNNTLTNLELSWEGVGTSGVGVRIANSSDNFLNNITARNRAYGVILQEGASLNEIYNSDFEGSAEGIRLQIGATSDNKIQNNNLSQTNNAVRDYYSSGSGNQILSNDMSHAGIAVNIVGNNQPYIIQSNSLTGVGAGLQLSQLSNLELTAGPELQMDFTGAYAGIVLNAVSDVTVDGFDVSGQQAGNYDRGIAVGAGSDRVVLRNIRADNRDLGVQVDSLTNGSIENLVSNWDGVTASGIGVQLLGGTNNYIDNVSIQNRAQGLQLLGDGTTVHGSFIASNTIGLATDGSGITLDTNVIQANTIGVKNSVGPIVTASNNYWGAQDGPVNLGGSGNQYDGSVLATPFLDGLPVRFSTGLSVGGPYAINESQTGELQSPKLFDSVSGAIVSPHSGSMEWDFNYDGSSFDVDATGQTVTFDASDIDGPVMRSIAIRAVDSSGVSAIVVGAVEVQSYVGLHTVVPSARAYENQPFGLRFSVNTGIGDTHSATIEWGDGTTSTYNMNTPGSFSFGTSHIYADDSQSKPGGAYEIVLTVEDDDGAVATTTVPAVILNTAPELPAESIVIPASATEGEQINLSFNVLSAPEDTHSITVDWGDGTSSAMQSPAAGSFSAGVAHTYLEDSLLQPNGKYSITLTVVDDDGGTTEVIREIAIKNTAPALDNLQVTKTEFPNGFVQYSGVFDGAVIDAGVLDTHSVAIDFGDGSQPETITLSGILTFTIPHQYNRTGQYSPMLTLADDDGGQVSLTLDPVQVIGNISIRSNASGHETGSVPGSFRIEQGVASSVDTVVTLTTGGTAQPGLDFSSVPLQVTIPAGGKSAVFAIPVIDDQLEEGTETVTLSIAEVMSADPLVQVAGAGTSAAIGIQDNDPDDDTDGVSDPVESEAPNNGDGNADGIPDALQENVTSMPNSGDGSYVTLAVAASGGGLSPTLEQVVASDNPSPTNAPNVDFSVGFVDYQVAGIAPGTAVTVTLYFDSSQSFTSYWKYGPTPNNTAPHWYDFSFDGTTGAVINGNEITLHFVDGDRGDDDLTTNGVIVDPGAPAGSLPPSGNPTSRPGTPYFTSEGSTVTLDGSASGHSTQNPATLSYEWDLYYDGINFDADLSGVRASTSFTDDVTRRTIALRVTDANGNADIGTTTLEVLNVAPIITSLHSSHPTFETRSDDGLITLTTNFADPGNDAHLALIDWGDGSPTETITVPADGRAFTAVHPYDGGGSFEIQVTVQDDDGGADSELTTGVVVGVGLVDGSLHVIGTAGRDKIKVDEKRDEIEIDVRLDGRDRSRKSFNKNQVSSLLVMTGEDKDDIDLDKHLSLNAIVHAGAGDDDVRTGAGNDQVFGGPGDDDIRTEDGDDLIVDLAGDNKVDAGDGNDVAHLGAGDDRVDGGAGDDFIDAGDGDNRIDAGKGNDTVDAGNGRDKIDGGDGDDVLRGGAGDDKLEGGKGNDILLGEAGDDKLSGDQGRDLLIGGTGPDNLKGDQQGDVLIGGFTAYDQNIIALASILNEWGSERSYDDRTNNLRNTNLDPVTFNARTNDEYFLISAGDGRTVFDDQAEDELQGGSGLDWFFAAIGTGADSDKLKGLKNDELIEDLI